MTSTLTYAKSTTKNIKTLAGGKSRITKKVVSKEVEKEIYEKDLDDISESENLDEQEQEEDDEEEEFFDTNSYNNFTKQYDLGILNYLNYVDNDINKEIIITPPEMRRTSEIMTIAEYTRVISERAKQIDNGSPIFCDIKREFDPIEIARLEIQQKRCPIKITRHITKFLVEEWDVNSMLVPFY